MTLLNAPALALLALAAAVLLLYFLRSRSRRHDVSALYLWQGLQADAESRSATFRERVDPPLLLQLLFLALLVFALADPAAILRRPQAAATAIAVDVSASMRAAAATRGTRFEAAIDEALRRVDASVPASTLVVAFARHASVVAALGATRDDVREALTTLRPGFEGDGTEEALAAVLRAAGGDRLERVVVLTDRALQLEIPGVEVWVADGRDNVAISAFHVRETESDRIAAFVRVANSGDTAWSGRVIVSGETELASVPLAVAAAAEETLTLALPQTQGLVFTASIDADDGFDADNERYAALRRPVEYHVRWFGEPDRFVLAALRADPRREVIVHFAGDARAALPEGGVAVAAAEAGYDLTVANGAWLPASIDGNILLLHATLEGTLELGETIAASAELRSIDHPLLEGIDVDALRVPELSRVERPPAAEVVLAAGDEPVVLTWEDAERHAVAVVPDLLRTNLPISVDLPLLIGNVLELLSRAPAPPTIGWNAVGEPLDVSGLGTIAAVRDPRGGTIAGHASLSVIVPSEPGVYWVESARGRFPFAVNVPAGESEPSAPTAEAAGDPGVLAHAATLLPFWTVLVLLALAALVAETIVYHRLLPRRTR